VRDLDVTRARESKGDIRASFLGSGLAVHVVGHASLTAAASRCQIFTNLDRGAAFVSQMVWERVRDLEHSQSSSVRYTNYDGDGNGIIAQNQLAEDLLDPFRH
jgi:hypothetical protein